VARPRLGHAFDVLLPSGTRATITCAKGEASASLPQAIESGRIQSSVDLLRASLADAHVIEAILCAIGAIAHEPTETECRNCHEMVKLDGAKALPIDLLLEPPGDAELDATLPADAEHELPRPVPIGRKTTAKTFRLAPRTLEDRVALEKILAEVDHLPLHARFVRALGLASLGEVKSPSAIARALEHLDDATFDSVWNAIALAWDETHYPPRLLAPVSCPKCGARHDVEVPAHRPLPFGRIEEPDRDDPPFPELDNFRSRAAVIAREVIEEIGLSEASGLEVIVDEGVPPCDDGGEPLLGSYTPTPEADGDIRLSSTSPFSIALYYRTFRSMYEEDGAYDVDAEIRETIEHELEHHVGFLRGSDPLDEEEREEIERERRRMTGGRPSDRLAGDVGSLFADIARFWRSTWPIWILAIAAVIATLLSSR